MMDPTSLMKSCGLGIEGIIHVGANVGQERLSYRDAGSQIVVHIEPIRDVFAQLQSNIRDLNGQFAVNALCSSRNGDVVLLNIASNGGESSSVFQLGNHASLFPHISYTRQEEVVTQTLDSIIDDQFPDAPFNFLVIDVQGAELEVLRGASGVLASVEAVYVEVSERPLYEGGCTFDEVSSFLMSFGFRCRWMALSRDGYGNAFYIHQDTIESTPLADAGRNLAFGKPAKQSSHSVWSKADDAQGAVNGLLNGPFGFHTNLEENPWWQVDLEDLVDLKEIVIHNRSDMCRYRARSLVVSVSGDERNWQVVHNQNGKTFGIRTPRVLGINVAGVKARFIRLELREREYLHLNEVQVF